MPTLVNNLRAIRGPVTAVPMVGASGVVVEPDTANNQVVVRADETVLWEGESTLETSIDLSESAFNFKEVRIVYRNNDGFGASVNIQTNPRSVGIGNAFAALQTITPLTNGNTYLKAITVNIDSTTGVTLSRSATGVQLRWSTTGGNSPAFNSSSGNTITVLKVIGINRKAQQG